MLLKVNINPSPRELRQFGWTLIIGFTLLGGLLFWRGKPHASFYLWGIGVPLGFVAICIPPAAKGLYRIWMGWAVFMGGIMTRVILTFLFFGVLMPVSLLFRCFGRDALRIKKNAASDSYWTEHRKITDRGYYQRLF